MIKTVYRFLPSTVKPSPFLYFIDYFRFVGYRIIRSVIQIVDGLLSVGLAFLGMETELYANFLYAVEKRRHLAWQGKYNPPN